MQSTDVKKSDDLTPEHYKTLQNYVDNFMSINFIQHITSFPMMN